MSRWILLVKCAIGIRVGMMILIPLYARRGGYTMVLFITLFICTVMPYECPMRWTYLCGNTMIKLQCT